jgi:flagellar biosynthesis chaperone FliJ
MATQDFSRVLDRYQRNLTEFKVSGNAALRTAVDVDKHWLNMYVAFLNRTSAQQQGFLQRFTQEYQRTNPDLMEMQAKLKEIREKGPVLQDAYETEVKGREVESKDFTMTYIKGALIVGVAVLVGFVTATRPL